MDDIWNIDGTTVDLDTAECEVILYLHEVDMAETTDVLHACESIGYRRKAHRVLDTLEDNGLISTRIDHSQTDDSAKIPPRVAMLSTRGKRFADEHEAELATADMDWDDLREEVHRLRQDLEAVEDRITDRQDDIEERLDDVGREGVSRLRADVDRLEDRVAAAEGTLENVPSGDDITRLRRDVADDIESARADLGDRINKTNTRVGSLEATVDVLEQTVEDLEKWVDGTENWIEDELIPTLRRIEPLVKAYESHQTDQENDADFSAIEGMKRLFSR